ncbi:MAG TPA: hypothetical protein DCS55_16595 [Acidimicrobiaceae bacterium]|nr:hypothetical protein [Acidimicrobiaceae bacterium]
MRGHLQQRGADSWRLKVFLGRSADGKKRYLERTVRGTRSEADQELARMVVEAGEGRWTPSAPMTMAELLDRWLKLKATTVEPSTVSNYAWIARQYVVPAFGDRKVASIRTMELDEFYARLRLSGGVGRRPLSGRTVRICHTVMRQSLDQARKWGVIARNPARDATPPSAGHSEVSPPSVVQVRDLLAAAFDEEPDFGVYLWLLATTGCRRGEGCALRWKDVSWDTGELLIRRNIAHVGRDIVEKATKTHQSRRVAIDASTLELLPQHQLRCRELALRVGVRLDDDAFLFSEEPDFATPWRPDVCTNRFGRLRATLGLESVRLHDLRHFTATELGQSGTPVATISARLGHRDKATTLNIYSHTLPATDALAAETISRLIGDPRRQHGS